MEVVIYGQIPDFGQIIDALRVLEKRINKLVE